jgi:hypothetical protein
MLKKVAFTVATVLVLFPASAFCSIETDINTIDLQRNELLKQVTTGLVNGKISIEDARKLKEELDNIIKLEIKAKEDPLSSPERLQNINSTLKESEGHISASTHQTKVWLGIDSRDNTLETKITNALDKKAISKEQAEDLKQQYDELRARESNGDPTRGFEFEDAIALADDIQTLNSKIDKAISGK